MPRKKLGRTRTRATAPRVRALERGLRLLETLGDDHSLSLSELAERTGLSPSTAYRLLETLRERHFVDWEASGLYRVGLQTYRVGAAYLAAGGLAEAAASAMADLVVDLNETVNLAVREGREAVYIQQREGQRLVRMFTRIGAVAPLHCTGVGKVLLAWREEAENRRLLGPGPFTRYTPNTLTELDELLLELARVRARGYAFDNEEHEDGVRCVAVPVHDQAGQVVAAISLSAPASRLPEPGLANVAGRMRAAARSVAGGSRDTGQR